MNMKTLFTYQKNWDLNKIITTTTIIRDFDKIITTTPIVRDWSTTTPAPTSPPPAVVLDPIMEEMMKMVNWTELEARFWEN